jgi:hypothetical protein
MGWIAVLCMAASKLPAQAVTGVRHVYAFMTEHQPGNIAVNPDGRPFHAGPDTVYTVYVETTAQDIQWKRAYIQGRAYTVYCRRVQKTPVEAGRTVQGGERIRLQAGKGGRLWQLDLGMTDEPPVYGVKGRAGEIVLEGRRGNKKMVVRVNKIIMLEGIPSV